MPGTDDLQEFIEERLIAFDPDIDLTSGSPAQVTIVDPIVNRYTPDPFEIDLPAFIRARLQQEYPNLSAEDGEAMADFLIKPMEALLDPIIREVTFLRNNKSLANPELLAPEEADSLMGNYFVRRTQGNKSVGTVRALFNSPIAISIGPSNIASTNDGLNYYPTTPQEISAEAMLFNQSGNQYYFDVAYEAEEEGDEYNVDVNTITSIANLQAAVKVTNLTRFKDGLPAETTVAYIERGELSLTERSLVVPRGALARLFDQFADLQHLQVVGFNDSEMQRDIITGGGLGSIIKYGTDGASSDDGDCDGYSEIFESPLGGFTSQLGAVGIVEDYVLTVADSDYEVLEVVSDYYLKIQNLDGTRSTLPDNLSSVPFYIRKNILTISGVPGGIINPSATNGTVQFSDNEVHIGGHSDFYIRGTSSDEEEVIIEAISDENPITQSVGLETQITGYPTNIVRHVGVDFKSKGVRTSMTLVIEGVGSYQILKISPGGLGNQFLQVSPTPSSPATNLRYRIVDEIDLDLNEPKTLRGNGTDLKTILGSKQVSTVSEIDFAAIGGEVEDTLRISGDTLNADDYAVKNITGTGNKILTLGSEMRKTSSSETWALFKLQNGIQPPIVRITSVDILDSSKQPTGDTIPYALPVDIQSFSFSNIGIGQKTQINDAIIGILGSVDISTPPSVNGLTIRIKINDGSTTIITFTGVTTTQDIIDQINAAFSNYNIAALKTVEGETRLSLRSRNNWIVVENTGTANSLLGLSTVFNEDNRQVISASTDFSAESLAIEDESDAVYILTGDNIEFWYLHAVDSGSGYNRLLISRVDESGGAIFPLTDERATVRVGSRSFGKVRCYFLEPTSFEVRGAYRKAALNTTTHLANRIYGTLAEDEVDRAEFCLDIYGDQTAYFRFFPDPSLNHYVLPVTDESVPNNLLVTLGVTEVESENAPATGPGRYSRNSEIDFLTREILPGDILEITYYPLEGTQDLELLSYPSSLLGLTLLFSLENGPIKTITFTASLTGVSKVASQINQQAGETIAYIEDTGGSGKFLRLEADFLFELLGGTAVSVLGLSGMVGDNYAPARGKYIIGDVGQVILPSTSNPQILSISSKIDDAGWTAFTSGQVGPSQHFKIYRRGVQRVSSTDMNNNIEGSLYYADIELVSYGPGDEFNIDPDLQLEASQFSSDGYRLTNEDENHAFSVEEELSMHIGRRMLTPGATDSPTNMIQLSQQNIQINYERSSLVENVQTFAQSELDRVLCANILVRHLSPHFVQFDLSYQNGSQISVVTEDIEDYINGLLPDEILEASAIAEYPRKRGATRVIMPITLLGIVHNIDRTIQIDRSQDAISRGRLATFIPDVLNITREVI
ncbi:MAG: hypothetical protein ACFFFC_01065 [Candidatus Thorarchaeota archaeon]